jgi:SpoVK/Ycf46/Vps4 family AAA+-type ATPase
MAYSVPVEELKDIAELCVGYVPADLAALVRGAALLSVTTLSPSSDEGRKSSFGVYLKRAMNDVGTSALRDPALPAPPTSTWDDIAC